MQLNARRALLLPEEERDTKEAAKDSARARARKAKEKEKAGHNMVEKRKRQLMMRWLRCPVATLMM